MIDVKDAVAAIAATVRQLPTESCPVTQSQGRVLAQAIQADRDLPPFDRVAMDGIAIYADTWQDGRRQFPVEGIHGAGKPAPTLNSPKGCLEVMTGAVLPIGCDTVIPYEHLDITDGIATVTNEAGIVRHKNVHNRGSDTRQGSELLQAGMVIEAPHMAVLASVGQHDVPVVRQPRIAVISNGDELVDVNESVEPHQIRRSNVYAIACALNRYGFSAVERKHLPDDEALIKRELTSWLGHYDVLLLSGGVSMGKFDFIPQALADAGVTRHFHKIRQRPGKPMWFGTTENGTYVFALPGNPVSTVMCFYRYVLDHLYACQGALSPVRPVVTLRDAVTFKPDLTYFIPVCLHRDGDRTVAEPRPTNGSGDFASLALADGFIQLSQGQDVYPAGYASEFYRW